MRPRTVRMHLCFMLWYDHATVHSVFFPFFFIDSCDLTEDYNDVRRGENAGYVATTGPFVSNSESRITVNALFRVHQYFQLILQCSLRIPIYHVSPLHTPFATQELP